MTGFALDGPGARFLYYLLNGDADAGHDYYDDAKAVEAMLPLPRLRVCVLTTVQQATPQSPAGAASRTAGFVFLSGFSRERGRSTRHGADGSGSSRGHRHGGATICAAAG